LRNKEIFIHYFVEDSVAFMLSVLPDTVIMVRQKLNAGAMNQVTDFMRYCSNKQQLNSHYDQFSFLSHALYKNLFEPLQLPPGRVILCLDNFFLPFETLCTDDRGARFLIYDYVFSYVYSARYLLKKMDAHAAKGKFIGFAPVAFKPYLGLPELKHSAQYLQKSASHYDETMLFMNSKASKQNFMHAVPDYSIVNIFSHAQADTADFEPILYMQDSVIHLSELQLLNRPATRLIMLSACQTNAGRSATGEGIYSLARGFSTAGIPSVAATLWKADEATIYAVSDKFNEYLAAGMRKDDALRKAKLYFMEHGEKEQLLPFYWANMVLLGNADPILFPDHATASWWWLWMAIPALAWIIYVIIDKQRKKIVKK
ncbi:MAG TPA: CHAT domain-containing protein, partial [Agriterribacter sp.]|nr:CHAT domain-containing protein [Agriterribacter sp.]